MSQPLTLAEQHELRDFLIYAEPNNDAPRIHIDNHGGWIIALPSGGFMHPRTFLDIIHGGTHGTSIIKQ